ncbi:MAG: hypothetical protein Q8O25_15645 [Sulfurisoma sp.]|nr:hypothetical protein [Sulfurisoma sp.]
MTANAKLGLVALSAAIVFVAVAQRLKSAPRQSVRVEMQVAMPLFVQVFMAAGDRNLAANIAAIRALVVETRKMTPDEFAILGKVQEDVSWLNPGHEDNYYIAAAILPWVGEVDPAQRILARATKARYYDYQPAFYYAFNQLHFKGDALGASAWMREAAEKLPEGDERLQMQNLAAIWLDKAQDMDLAIRVVEGMAQQAKRRDFRSYLEMRVARLRGLKDLRAAAVVYRSRFARPLVDVNDLVASGVLRALPDDPFGFGYEFNKQGDIVLRNRPPPKKP